MIDELVCLIISLFNYISSNNVNIFKIVLNSFEIGNIVMFANEKIRHEHIESQQYQK